MPQNWVDAILISVFKGKGLKSVCGDYQGISLLEAVGKVFAKLLLNRLTKWIVPLSFQRAIVDSDLGVARWT